MKACSEEDEEKGLSNISDVWAGTHADKDFMKKYIWKNTNGSTRLPPQEATDEEVAASWAILKAGQGGFKNAR